MNAIVSPPSFRPSTRIPFPPQRLPPAQPMLTPSRPAEQLLASIRHIAVGLPGDLETLESALADFARDCPTPRPQRWSDTSGRYTRILLSDADDDFQVIVVFWPPGARSAIHDHADTRGAVAALFGEVSETKYAVIAQTDGDEVALEARGTTRLAAGTVSHIEEAAGLQLHDMVNESCGWAATVHVYLRPIRHFHVYRALDTGGFGREERTLWFDYDSGAQAWDEPSAPPSCRSGELGRSGSCACGALRFESSSAPVLELRCFCTDCQKSTGSAMAPLAFFPSDALTITGGEPHAYSTRNDSGYLVTKEFCPCCGTTLFHRSTSYPHLQGVPVGVLDDSQHFRPTTNIYIGSAPAWAERPGNCVGSSVHH